MPETTNSTSETNTMEMYHTLHNVCVCVCKYNFSIVFCPVSK